jgi:hypothetical protein
VPRRVVAGAILLLLGCYLFGHTMPRAWRSLNTDFPDYYLAARLYREGVDPSRAYEWIWLQREKDHRDIDQRVVGLVPITPFSTLAMWPLAGLPPLVAKHAWLVFNLALLFPIAWLMSSVSGLSLLEVGCLLGLSFPLHRNLLYGQYYIVLLGILTAACWAMQRQWNRMAGSLIALGVAVKIFPVILALHFVRKKNWRALLACLLTGILCLLVSVSAFGWSLHRTYVLQVLPWTLRGEVLDPYNLGSSSLSTLLHRLFIFEPQLNAHPALRAPWLFIILHPVFQLALLLPALLCIDASKSATDQTSLEWSALLLSTLTLTPLPASYHFTVLVLPVAIICGRLLKERRRALLTVVIALYLAVGYPGWNVAAADGWHALLQVKRLYALILLTVLATYLIKSAVRLQSSKWWLAGAAAALVFSIAGGLKHQRGLFEDYSHRLPMGQQSLLAAQPVPRGNSVEAITLLPDGYRRTTMKGTSIVTNAGEVPGDELSLTAAGDQLWTETVGLHSVLERSPEYGPSIVDAESPALLDDGQKLAFLRQINGRKRLFVRDLAHPSQPEQQLTTATSPWNVEEIAVSPSKSLVISATKRDVTSRLYQVLGVDQLELIPAGEARFPAISPDGRWLAFSTFRGGYWNLALRDLNTGATRPLTNVSCDQTMPAWLPDSKTLLYGSDCGRALGFTALTMQRFLP